MKNLYKVVINKFPFDDGPMYCDEKYFLANDILSVVNQKEFDIYENQEVQPGHPNPKYFKIYKNAPSREFVEFYLVPHEEI